ncbi:MAG: RNA polymerase sigma factor [Bacteroidota bacterium]
MFFTFQINLRLIIRKASHLTDHEIIEECRKGNLNSFGKLVVKTSPFAFSVAFRMLGDENIAEDIVQDTMLTVWQKIGKIKSSDGFKMWLYRIVINKCYDEMRRKKRSKEYTPDASEWGVISNHLSHDPAKEMENRETAALINLLTGSLSPKQKAVFVLCDLEEMSPDEVSAITGMRKANVKANLHYARKRISEMINKYD